MVEALHNVVEERISTDLDFVEPDPRMKRELDRIAEAMLPEFRSLVSKLIELDDSIGWQVSPVSSGHTYACSLFRRCMSIRYFLERVQIETAENEGKVIRTNDYDLGIWFRQFLKSEGINWNVDIVGEEKQFRRTLGNILGPWIQWLRSVFYATTRFLARSPNSKNDYRDLEIRVVDTFILEEPKAGGIDEDGEFVDRYYPGLKANLPSGIEEQIWWWPTVIGGKQGGGIRRLRRAKERFIVPDDWLRLSDWIALFREPFRLKRIDVSAATFDGQPIDSLLMSEIRKTFGNWSSMMGHLYYRAIHRMAESGVTIKQWLDWYENQPIDRGVIRGLREAYPEVPIIGYQGFVVCPVFNHYAIPNSAEVARGLAPDEICTVSRHISNRSRQLNPGIDLREGPAFRFTQSSASDERENNQIPVVLVTLPISLIESEALIEFVGQALAQKTFNIKIRVKGHPVHSKDEITELLNRYGLEDRCAIAEGNFSDLLAGADGLIGLSSSTCVEAWLAGKSVAICSVGGDMTQIPTRHLLDADDMVSLCYSSEDLEATLNRMADGDVSNSPKEGFFESVDEEGCLRLVAMDLVGDEKSEIST